MGLVEVLFNKGNMYRLTEALFKFGENVNIFLAMC